MLDDEYMLEILLFLVGFSNLTSFKSAISEIIYNDFRSIKSLLVK